MTTNKKGYHALKFQFIEENAINLIFVEKKIGN